MNRFSRLVVAVVLLALTACAPLGLRTSPAPVPVEPEASELVVPEPPPPEPAPAPEPPPPPPPPDPDVLIGLEAPALEARLGKPELKRREGRAQVWRYDGTDCVLHVFLYARAGRPAPRVTRIEATPVLAGQSVDRSACFAALLDAAGKAQPQEGRPVPAPPDAGLFPDADAAPAPDPQTDLEPEADF